MKTPRFQLIASFITMVMIGNLQYTWTVFIEPIRAAHTTWSLHDVQLAATIYIALQTWVQPLNGWVIDKIGQRPFITVAGVLVAVGWSLMGYAPTTTILYLLYATAGVGAAFVYSGAMGSAVKWFPYRKGFASGVAAAGYGGGSAIFVFVIRHLMTTYDYKTAFLVTGITQGVVILIVAQFLRHPDSTFNPPKPAVTAVASKSRRGTENWTTPEMLSTPMFYILYAMFVAMGTGGLFLATGAGPLTKDWGLAASLTAAQAFGLVANALSRPSWGWVSDRAGRENTMVVAFFLQAIALLSVLTLGKTSGLMFGITLVFTYFTWGEIYSLFPSAVGDYYGTKNATSNNAFLYSAKGVSAIIGIYLPALLREYLGSWDAVLLGGVILALISSLMALFLRTVPLPQKAKSTLVANA